MDCVGAHRDSVADFWDSYFDAWLGGDDPVKDPLPRWKASYRGTGLAAVQEEFSADPYTGDLRGEKVTPRMVMLGLNPGVGYPELHGRRPLGTWMDRIASSSYSRCLNRFPYGDPAWRMVHGKESTYWQRIVAFSRRWTGDDDLAATAILNMELYPWHSQRLASSALRPPTDVIDAFIWGPIAEVDVPVVFAFGKPWDSVAKRLGLPVLAHYGPTDLGAADMNWNVVVYSLASQQRLIVNWQRGNSTPPGAARLTTFRQAVDLTL